MNAELEEWLEGRPAVIRQLAQRFPPGSYLEIDGKRHWVMSYNEDGSICVSAVNPFDDYDAAFEARELICADCLPK